MNMNERDYLTTGEIAGLARCSQQTVIREIDRGNLKGYRMPGSGHRRVLIEDVRIWMRSHGIPEDMIDNEFGLDQSEQDKPVPDMQQTRLVHGEQGRDGGDLPEGTVGKKPW